MPQVDLIEESFVVAAPERVAAALHETARWAKWWPDLVVSVFQDRGEQGIRWNVGGALVGSMEVWLEPHRDGVMVHHYVRADAADAGSRSARALRAEVRRRARHAKQIFWDFKDEMEGVRRTGEARVDAA